MIPAVVVGAEINGLGVIRGLAATGAPIVVADTDPGIATARSRHVARRVRLRAFAGPTLVEDLIALAKSLSSRSPGRPKNDLAPTGGGSDLRTDPGAQLTCRPVLIPTRDETVLSLSEHRDALLRHYRFELGPAQATAEAMSKAGFYRQAEAGGFPVPRTLIVDQATDLAELAGMAYPCAVKPAWRDEGYEARFDKCYRVDRREEAEALCRRILDAGIRPLIVQTWLEGPDDDLFFCLQYHGRPGHALASFTGRKIRAWPRQIGATAICAPAPDAAARLEPLTTAFFGHVGLTGWCAMEYKRDRTSGDYFMVEPTIGRTDMQCEVAALNGVNLPAVAYASLTDTPLPPAVRAARFAVWQRDFLSGLAARRGDRRLPDWLPPNAAWVDGVWRLEDPFPGLVYYPQRVLGALGRRLRRPG